MFLEEIELYGYIRFNLNSFKKIKLVFTKKIQAILGTNGSGKAQPLRSPIKIPGGWKKMGDMQVGDEVIAKDGSTTKVNGVFPQGIKQTYKINFSDGRSTHATGDHLWKVYCGKKYPIVPEIMNTNQIIEQIKIEGKKKISNLVWVDLVDSEESPDIELPVEPYLFGQTLKDECISHTKGIPDIYLNSSTKQRLELLQGLMDSAGYIDPLGATYRTSNKLLASNVQYLVRSLGGIAKLTSENWLDYTVNIKYKKLSELFKLPMKKKRANDINQYASSLRLYIESIEESHIEHCQCISIDHTEKLYITDDFVVTHNSSLMEELSPLPAESKNFTKDGYKIVKYRHRGKRYILSSRFDPVFHSIKIEGEDEELNPGGTITVQRDLVKKIFNIDAKKHALAIGKHEFHSMGVETRKEWFRLLSDVNYDYAINTFKRIKDEFRDTTGALKLARNKLVSQSSKMMPKDDLEALIRDCEELYKVVEFMIDNRNSPSQSLDQTKHDIEHSLKDLEDYSTMVIETIQDLDRFLSDPIVKSELTDIRDASSLAFFVNTKLNELKERKVELFKEHKKCSDNLDLFEKTKLFKVASISTELEELKKKKAQLEGSLIYNFPTYDPQQFLENLEIIAPNLLELVLEIPINKGSTKFTRDGYKIMVDRRQGCSRAIDILKVNIKTNKESIDHHLKHKDEPSLSCPKCKHSWNPRFNANVIKDIELKIEEDSKKIKENEAIIEDLDIQIEEFDKWVQHLEAIKELSRNFGEMKDFWSLIMKKELLFENPRNIANIVTLYKTDLFAQRSLGEVNKRIDEELEKLDLAEHTQGFDYQQATITIERISIELELIANEENRLNSIKAVANSIVRAIKRIDGCEQEILSREKEIDNLVSTFNEDSLRILFNQILRSFQSELAIKEKAINDEKMQESTLKSLEDEIANLEELSEAYKLVLTELSPTQGIIAEGIFGFMKLYIKKMNKFISTIWSYPLVVQPCSSEEGKIELSYKFPLMAGTAHKPRPDVAEGSASMRQVINLSFVISALKALGLGEGSLFLDEFGSAMDPVHKAKTARMVSDIVENEKFSQIFIISHDVAQYSSLDNTEVAIINSANVIIPTGCIYNQHVEFE